MHAGRQDIAILRRAWDTQVTNVFDTQLAAGFIGFGNQEGYESLVRKVLGVQLKGSEGFTKWDHRPLTSQQLEYAADDARLLLALATASSSASSSAAGSTGRARSAGRSSSPPTRATPGACSSACRGSAGSTRRRERSPSSWSTGARRTPARWTARPATSFPTTP